MMEAVRAWLTSVVLVSVLLSAAQSLIPPGTVRKAAGFTGGLILLLVLLRPVLGADLEHLELDFDHYQAAVVTRTVYPTYRGALVVCQGGDRADVKLAVTEAVAALTGLSADRITVAKSQ